jgi:hypothetical protein
MTVLCAAALLLAGCSKGVKLADVKGTLTYKGKAVPNTYVDFTPEDGKGRPSWGLTDEQGHFTLSFDKEREGAILGKHRVSVRFKPTTKAEQEAVMMGRKPPLSREMTEFFDRYTATGTNKVVEITPDTRDLAVNFD